MELSLTLVLLLFTAEIGCGQNSTNSTTGDAASRQLEQFRQANPNPPVFTTSNGAPVWNKNAVLTAGPRGPILLQDFVYMDEMAHFDRERIPERVVHAKGAGAHGFFEVTNDITMFTKASMFATIGKRTPCFWRFSTVGGEMGSADTARDPRGFAMKYYTDEGNWDLVGNNSPIFFIRDPILFPNFVHTQKRNPVTNLKDPDAMWDFWSLRPEALNMILRLFSDLGTPDGFRKMDGFGSHTFKLVNQNGTATWCKFHLKTRQGVQNLTAERANELSGSDPDYATRDLYNAIENGDFPQWDFMIQVMTLEQADTFRWNPFDVTKIWPENEFPLIPVGRVTLDRNPSNYFAEVEQSAFAPARMVPGIEASPDKMLQGRLFAYPDTQFHRLGPNFMKLPINCPFRVNNTQVAGAMRFDGNEGGAPNYHPTSFNGPVVLGDSVRDHRWSVANTTVDRFNSGEDSNYDQPATMWAEQLDDGGRCRLANNIAGSLRTTMAFIQERALREFSQVNATLAQAIREAMTATFPSCPDRLRLITTSNNNTTLLVQSIQAGVATWSQSLRLQVESYVNSINACITNTQNGCGPGPNQCRLQCIINVINSYSTNNVANRNRLLAITVNTWQAAPCGASLANLNQFVRCG